MLIVHEIMFKSLIKVIASILGDSFSYKYSLEKTFSVALVK